MLWRRWPLAAKLTLAMTMLVILAVAGVTLLSIQREQSNFRTEHEQQAQLLLNTLEVTGRDALYTLDADYLKHLIEDFAEVQAGNSRIYDSEGRLVVDSDAPGELVFRLERDLFGQRLVQSDATVFDWQADVLLAGQAVVIGRQRIGAVSVTLPTAPLAAKMEAVRNNGIATALAAALAGTVLSLVVSRTITGPLRELTEATERISSGDFSHRITLPGGDELSILGNAFNRMAGQLEETVQKVEQRAKEFADANQDLIREIAERERAEATLRASEERQRLILGASPDPIVIYDLQGHVQSVNTAFEQTFGWTEAELLGKRIDFVPEDQMEVTRAGIEQLLREGRIPPTDTRRLTRDGEVLDVQGSGALYRDRSGNPAGSIVIFRDIRERILAEATLRESEERKAAILEAALDCIISIDHEGTIIEFNPAAESTFGYRRDEVIGQRMAELIVPPAYREKHHQGLAHYLTTGEGPVLGQRIEIAAMRADGSEFPIELAVLAVQRANNPMFTAYLRDITERKQAEQEREQMIQELQVANAKVLETSWLKSEFLATMSHELRTPLNVVIGFSGIMLEGMAGQVDDQARYMVQAIYDSSYNLLGMINDVLDLSKIEAGRMELVVAPLSIPDLVGQWQSQMDVIAQQKGLPFEVEVDPATPPSLYGDKDHIRQIVVNLLSNAFKFTERGRVKLEVKWEHESLVIRVSDTGVGIPPHALNYIFDEFRQVDSSSQRQYGGTGLGLAIVRRLCLMMGGSVQVNSKLGEGSIFTVNLPLQPAA